tara:strand:- start:71 stop:325 length:255 start_codon:yes stop_codon:yes gene_type:complete
MSSKAINVTIFEEKYPSENSPLATVRYTEYDLNRKVERVNQVEYHDPAYFHSQVLQAVSYGMDVSIFTPLDVEVLQKKIRHWTS